MMFNKYTNSTTHETLSPVTFTCIGVYLALAGIVGAVASGIALFIFFSNKNLQSPTNTFIIGLLFSDMLMCLIGVPLPAASNLAHRWLFGWYGCVFNGFTVYFLGLSNLYILAAISVDRYLVISKPLQAVYINHKVARISLFVCYFFGFLWSSFPFFGWSSFAYEGAGTSCAISYDYYDSSAFSYNITICFNCFIIPIIIMLICYYNVFRTVKSLANSSAVGNSSRIARRNMLVEKKLAKTIVAMIGVYLFAWTPYAITAFWVAFGLGEVPLIVGTLPAMFAKTASVWNPFIYVFSNKEFRKALYEKIAFFRICRKTEETGEENSDSLSTVSRLPTDATTVTSNITTIQLKHFRKTRISPIINKDIASTSEMVLTGFMNSPEGGLNKGANIIKNSDQS